MNQNLLSDFVKSFNQYKISEMNKINFHYMMIFYFNLHAFFLLNIKNKQFCIYSMYAKVHQCTCSFLIYKIYCIEHINVEICIYMYMYTHYLLTKSSAAV